MITKAQLQGDGFRFTVSVPAAAIITAVRGGESAADWQPSYAYRTAVKSFNNNGYARTCLFIESLVGKNWVYVGTVESDGTLRLTAGSKIPADKPRVRLAQRIVKAVWDGRGAAVEAAGYGLTAGDAPQPIVADLPAEPETNLSKSLRFLADAFTVAVGYGLKRPMLRLHFGDRRFKFYLSNRGTVCLKTGALTAKAEDGSRDPIGDEEYAGCLVRGRFLPAKVGGDHYAQPRTARERELLPTEKEFMGKLVADPVGFVAQCGKDMCRCCYCGQPLEDARSKAVGYGETCAKRWGLPWGSEKAVENAPSFAKSWDEDAHGLLNAIRDDKSGDTTRWLIFADWLQEKGLPRCEVPKAGAQLPRNDN